MRETNIMQWITLGGIAFLIYLLLRFNKTGNDQLARPPLCQDALPNRTFCNVAFVSDNPAIPLAADYLSCGTMGHVPAVSLATLRRPINYNCFTRQAANCQATVTPHSTRQCVAPPSYLVAQNPCSTPLCLVQCCDNANCSAIPV